MASIQHFTFLILLSTSIHALPTTNPPQSQDNFLNNPWSTEAILGLTAIVVAVICCVVSLAWPTICRRFRWRGTAAHSLIPLGPHPPTRPDPFVQEPWQRPPVTTYHHYNFHIDRAVIQTGREP
ncbi:hypothetical protein C7974DRAFT_400329 [Boeremia exigua]|uniref:uncharacterized protein n=1 Tax=Boeremia exigua TaxID=749465 RepID=UPI001E8ECB73|nr:uncharacterized protein C7974DRAFT_400329 [Boeremia exigua]KAH6618540.1 hypothetical protein C7974DRAFT_400329 [Boeremia exigua]